MKNSPHLLQGLVEGHGESFIQLLLRTYIHLLDTAVRSAYQGVSVTRNILHMCGHGTSNILFINICFLGTSWVQKKIQR